MTPSDVEFLFRQRLGIRLGDDMSDYLVRRFMEGGAASAPLVPPAPSDEIPGAPVRRFNEMTDLPDDSLPLPVEPIDPLLQ